MGKFGLCTWFGLQLLLLTTSTKMSHAAISQTQGFAWERSLETWYQSIFGAPIYILTAALVVWVGVSIIIRGLFNQMNKVLSWLIGASIVLSVPGIFRILFGIDLAGMML